MKDSPGAILARMLHGEEQKGDEQKFIESSKKALGPACESFKFQRTKGKSDEQATNAKGDE